MEIPEEKVYSVRLKKNVHRAIMEHLENGIPQHILVEALVRYFNDVESQHSATLSQVLAKLDVLHSMLESRLSNPDVSRSEIQDEFTPVRSDVDPLTEDVTDSVMNLLGL
ncbi:hypothetical protein [Alicyclobacillus sp. SO9]|uniref:hypothetical protein n=1 Tax=Alicyclobacillus sp. SO9 TaxID=2665646 RepID=UPI0018E868D2|nr:hypothetical protein [Alicyclobacillus sp. SO9]QQE79727.1 hypothetical protein GI364_04355 [Alicyclobacillus sp. SO9]